MLRYPIFLLLLLSLFAARPAAAETDLCAAEAAAQERAGGIPSRLLHAISLAETGRWDDERRASFAWPWTVTAEGEGRFLPSRQAAIAEVRSLQARGVRNIDVGCMQVNLQHHPDAFANLDEAFDPRSNVAYAARFLKDLRADAGSWTTAAAHYHSHTPHLAAAYRAKILRLWQGQETTATAPAITARAAENTARREQVRQQTQQERDEARTAAETYRAARMAEYAARRQVALSMR